jgi:hypothetical protein
MDLQEVDVEGWTGSIWLRIGTGHGVLVNAVIKPSSSIKYGGFLH